jgi:hypothetical protein
LGIGCGSSEKFSDTTLHETVENAFIKRTRLEAIRFGFCGEFALRNEMHIEVCAGFKFWASGIAFGTTAN